MDDQSINEYCRGLDLCIDLHSVGKQKVKEVILVLKEVLIKLKTIK